jgi:hypothetical protein
MKITLDISKLVEEGKLTREEADKLTALAAHDTGSLGINILIGFGVIAIAAGAVALVPTPLSCGELSPQGARSCSTACSNGSCSGRFALSLAR